MSYSNIGYIKASKYRHQILKELFYNNYVTPKEIAIKCVRTICKTPEITKGKIYTILELGKKIYELVTIDDE